MTGLTSRRILAFGLDYLVIITYALALFGIASLINPGKLSPFVGQALGFISLTLPVYLYFYLMENSRSGATLGKKVMSISVYSEHKHIGQSLLLRNSIKFIPWEMAHFGVHWIVYFSSLDHDPPVWVWIALILPQVIVFGYIVSIFLYKGESSFYDKLAKTGIKLNQRARKNKGHQNNSL